MIEYMQAFVESGPITVEELNKHGEDGWDLTAVVDGRWDSGAFAHDWGKVYIFKRTAPIRTSVFG